MECLEDIKTSAAFIHCVGANDGLSSERKNRDVLQETVYLQSC
jgi:hypothetical protein